jgi:hypothetical protein
VDARHCPILSLLPPHSGAFGIAAQYDFSGRRRGIMSCLAADDLPDGMNHFAQLGDICLGNHPYQEGAHLLGSFPVVEYEQIAHFHFQCFADFLQRIQGRVKNAALDPAYRVWVNAYQFGKFFLGEVIFFPDMPDSLSKQLLDCCHFLFPA